MKDVFVQLSLYNCWANRQLLDYIAAIREELPQPQGTGSGSLLSILLHMWDAESVWWQRMKLFERIDRPGSGFDGHLEQLSGLLQAQNRQWAEWVSVSGEHVFAHVFQYWNSNREQIKQPIFEMLLHLFNHGTYHRGQLVLILKQMGCKKVPKTDFILWSRAERKKRSARSR